jgi:RimJ/RimL family protein N-acetyltransferase
MTQQLNLIPLALEHASFIHEAIHGNVAEYFYNFQTIDETRVWVTEAIAKHREGTKKEFVVFDGDTFIGMISPAYTSPEEVEIGMWVTPTKQGCGYGARILSTLLERLRTEGVKRVIYETEKENIPSVRLAESLGFTLVATGTLMRFTKRLY